MEKTNKLCVRQNNGTLDIWINYDNDIAKLDNNKMHVITTYNGEKPEHEVSCGLCLGNQDDETIEKQLNWLMGIIGRDTQNWFIKDIVIHWGVHTWKFYNKQNVVDIEKDEYTKNLEDIKMNYDVEW